MFLYLEEFWQSVLYNFYSAISDNRILLAIINVGGEVMKQAGFSSKVMHWKNNTEFNDAAWYFIWGLLTVRMVIKLKEGI